MDKSLASQIKGQNKETHILRGAWAPQPVKHLTLDLGSDHDLMVHEFKPLIGLCADGTEPAWDSVSPSLCPAPTCVHYLSLSQKKKKLKKYKSNNTFL